MIFSSLRYDEGKESYLLDRSARLTDDMLPLCALKCPDLIICEQYDRFTRKVLNIVSIYYPFEYWLDFDSFSRCNDMNILIRRSNVPGHLIKRISYYKMSTLAYILAKRNAALLKYIPIELITREVIKTSFLTFRTIEYIPDEVLTDEIRTWLVKVHFNSQYRRN